MDPVVAHSGMDRKGGYMSEDKLSLYKYGT